MSAWQLPTQPNLPPIWQLVDVLVDVNGPQIMLLKDDGKLTLAVAADESEDAAYVRWILAETSPTEVRAFRNGDATALDLLWRPVVSIVDTNQATVPLCAWRVPITSVPKDAMPDADSWLPSEMVSAFSRRSIEQPTIAIDGDWTHGRTLTFRLMSEVLSQVQRLWHALTQLEYGEATNEGRYTDEIKMKGDLGFASTSPGSLIVHIGTPHRDVFATVADMYRSLAVDSHEARELLSTKRVASAYRDFRGLVRRTSIQTYLEWGTAGALVSANQVQREYDTTDERVSQETRKG